MLSLGHILSQFPPTRLENLQTLKIMFFINIFSCRKVVQKGADIGAAVFSLDMQLPTILLV